MENDYANSIDIDDIDYGYEGEITDDNQPDNQPDEQSVSENNEPQQEEFNLEHELLTRQGIKDINKIKFQDDSGAMIEKSWDSLTNEEKVMILSHQEDPETSLDDDEIKLINKIRESGLAPDQYIQSLKVQEQPVQTFAVDELSDDEIYCLDLLDKVGADNISDEELQQILDQAKSNENLYKRQVASLRVHYKDLEEQNKQRIEEEKLREEEAKYYQFTENVKNSIKNFNSFEDTPVELSIDDMEDLANYILTKDATGYSEFGKSLNDTNQIAKIAFWMLNGPKLLNEMQNQIKEAYLRGYNETHKQPTKVFKKESSKGESNNKDTQFAYFDEESYLNN